jgi:hypothetical protein
VRCNVPYFERILFYGEDREKGGELRRIMWYFWKILPSNAYFIHAKLYVCHFLKHSYKMNTGLRLGLSAGLLVACFVFLGCNRSNSSYGGGYDSGDHRGTVDHTRTEEEIREDLATRERSNPASYLSFDGTYRMNIWGETVIEGTISNAASIAKFKDAVLQVTGYSKTKSKIGTWEETVYEYFAPGRAKTIKVKMFLPSEVKSIRVEVVDASAVD